MRKSDLDKLSEKKLVCLRDVPLFRQHSMPRIARGGSSLRIFPAFAAVFALLLSSCGNGNSEESSGNDFPTETHMTNRGIVDDVFRVTTAGGSDSAEEHTASESDQKEMTLFTEQVNILEGVTMEVINVDSPVATIEMKNSTDLNIIYEEEFYIQTLIDDEWYSLPMAENTEFFAISHTLEKDVPAELTVDWNFWHGEIEPGFYRIVKPVTDSRAGYSVNYYLAADFMIPKDSTVELGEKSSFEISERDDISYSVTEASSRGAKTHIENNSGQTLYWGSQFFVEKKVDGEWFTLTYIELPDGVEAAWTTEMRGVESGSAQEEENYWISSYWYLPEGEYRIIKKFHIDDAEHFPEYMTLAAEFTIEYH